MAYPYNASKEILESICATPSDTNIEKKSTTSSPVAVEAAAIILRRKKRESMLKICSLILRWLCFVFSFIAFVVTVSNRHGKGINFEDYEEYSYLMAIAIISTVYSAYQGIREIIQLVNLNYSFPQPVFSIIDFIADQILAYLLMSAASEAVPLTNRGRKDNTDSIVLKFVDTAAAAISMAFLAFFTSALSLLISGYKLSHLIHS